MTSAFFHPSVDCVGMCDPAGNNAVKFEAHQAFASMEKSQSGLECDPEEAMALKVSVETAREFSIKLHIAVGRGKNGDENLVLCPLSVGLALAMAAGGAKGATFDQINSCLTSQHGLPLQQFCGRMGSAVLADGSGMGGPLIACANRAWVEKSLRLKATYQKLLRDSYGSEAAQVDFQNQPNEAREAVNSWVLNETKQKISDLLPAGAVGADTALILTNAIYFKGAWRDPFDEEMTRDGPFYPLNGTTITVPMMRTDEKQYIKSFSSFKALRLPYLAGDDTKRSFSMCILLPHERHGLAQLEQSLDATWLGENLSSIRRAVTVSPFQLPRFKVSCGFEPPEALKSLGIHLPFDASCADFSELVDSARGFYIQNMFHKAFVEVNEKGTEAAAATSIRVALMSLSIETPEHFVADHPFMFVILEEQTNVILFTGRVTNPIAEPE